MMAITSASALVIFAASCLVYAIFALCHEVIERRRAKRRADAFEEVLQRHRVDYSDHEYVGGAMRNPLANAVPETKSRATDQATRNKRNRSMGA